MLSLDLRGKIALVTGASGELGSVIAKTLADCGADMILHAYTNREKAEKLAAEIRGMGVKCEVVTGDVGSETDVYKMRDYISQTIGMPSIVVACAVVQYHWTTVLAQGAEDYESQFRSCVLQSVFLAKAFVPAMMEKGWGRMIGINTECAMQCFESQSAYASAKRGMDGVYRVLAREVGNYGITVNQVAPGWTISERDRREHTEVREDYEKGVPRGKRGADTEIAAAVAFLASGLADNITGVYLPVCGGNVMPGI